MKLTFISLMEGSPWGGSEELWYKTALLALAVGHQVQICVKYWANNDKFESIAKLGARLAYRKDITTTLSKRVLNKIGFKEETDSYLNDIKDFSPDAILISQGDTFSYFFHPLYQLIQQLKVPYTLISQFNTETGGLLYKGIIDNINQGLPWKNFYFVAKRNLVTAQRQYGGKLNNTTVINNPVNIVNRALLPWPTADGLKLACVARLECSYKGQDVLIEALAHPVFKDKNFELNFFGTGPDEMHLKRLITYFGLEGKAFIRGHVKNIDEIWDAHHVLVLPSIAEGTPLSLQECMLKGRPALTTDVGGCADLVIDGSTGFLSPTCSAASLKKTLSALFDTPGAKLKVMGANAFTHANAMINPEPAKIIFDGLTSLIQKT